MILLLGLTSAKTWQVPAEQSLEGACGLAGSGDTIEITGDQPIDEWCLLLAPDITVTGVGSRPALATIAGTNVTASNLTIHGTFENGAQAVLSGVSRLDNVTIDGSTVGGEYLTGLYAEDTDLTLTGMRFTGHSGVSLHVSSKTSGHTLDIEDAEFFGNATSGYFEGIDALAVTIRDARVTGNGTDSSGTGGFVVTGNTNLSISDSLFQGNDAGVGNSLYILGSNKVTVQDTAFIENRSGPVVIASRVPELTFERTRFCLNNAPAGNGPSGLLWADQSGLLVSRSVFQSNTGGVETATVLVEAADNADLINNTFVANQMDLGAVLATGELKLVNNLFDGPGEGLTGAGQDVPLAGGYNAWSAIEAFMQPTDLFLEDVAYEGFDFEDCASLPIPVSDSPLVDAGHPDTKDDDGSPTDIGAYAANWTEGGDTGLSSFEAGPRSGGCSHAPASGLLVSLLLVARRRSRA